MATCPYCDSVLQDKPKRKKKCPKCGEYIYVKKGVLYTEYDRQLSEFAERFESLLEIETHQVHEHRDALQKQFGSRPSPNDVAWKVLNEFIRRDVDWSDRGTAYNELARIARMEDKDPTPYLKESARAVLMGLKLEGPFSEVKPRTVNDSHVCERCRSVEDRVFPIDQAIEELPIPTVCQNPDGCRCWYVPHTSLDSLEKRMRDILEG